MQDAKRLVVFATLLAALGLSGRVFGREAEIVSAPATQDNFGVGTLAEGLDGPGSSGGPCIDAHCQPLCCRPACCGYRYVQADFLLLDRNNSTGLPVVLSDATGAVLLETNSVNLESRGGVRFFVGQVHASGWGWEAGYFGVYDWANSAAVVAANNLDVPGDLAAATNDFNNASAISLNYESEIQNVEFNVLRECGAVRLLAGFRYLNLDETFNIRAFDADGDVSDYRTRTANNLFGGQLGMCVRQERGMFGYEAAVKTGLFANDAIQRQVILDDGNTFGIRSAHARETAAAFVTDCNLCVLMRLTDQTFIRAGYYLLYVSEVALAPDQLDFTDLTTSGFGIDSTGDVFVHGVNIGLEARW